MRWIVLPTREVLMIGDAVDVFTHRDRRGRLRTYIANPNHRDCPERKPEAVRVVHLKPGLKPKVRAA
jgi:hypothetical protein